MKNSKLVNGRVPFWAATGFIIALFASSCTPWGPGIAGPGTGGMGGMMGGGGMGNMGQGDMGNMGQGGMGQDKGGDMMGGGNMEDMMRRMHGGGMMGQGGMGQGNMGGMTGLDRPSAINARPITIEQAIEAAKNYISGYGPDLTLSEIMEFAQNFYAIIKEKSSGTNAMELLVDRYTGQVYPEMGPNMVWNIKYGMMPSSPRIVPPVLSPQEAASRANEFLSRLFPGFTANEARPFYGYYTLNVLREGRIEGMLSINAYTGQVWYHDWHGLFLNLKKLK